MIFGLSLPALVGLLVEVLKQIGMITTGDQARIANIVLSGLGSIAIALMAEFNFEADPLVITIVTSVYSIVAAAFGYEQIKSLKKKDDMQ